MKERTALGMIQDELERAQAKHPNPFHSYHEGKSIIEEEYDELWDEIKIQKPDGDKIRKEAVQLAAMALRFLIELC